MKVRQSVCLSVFLSVRTYTFGKEEEEEGDKPFEIFLWKAPFFKQKEKFRRFQMKMKKNPIETSSTDK